MALVRDRRREHGHLDVQRSRGLADDEFQSERVLVSLVQVANSLPMFLFALPAGALADIVDKRRFILALEVLIAAVSGAFAALVSFDLVTPGTLLVFMFRRFVGARGSGVASHRTPTGSQAKISAPPFAVINRAQSIAQTSRSYLDHSFANTNNPRLVRGHARLDGKVDARFGVRVGEHTILAKEVVINTGTRSRRQWTPVAQWD